MAVLLAVAIAFGIWVFPVKGKANNEFWLSSDTYRLEDTVVLQKETGKDFKILNLADIQYDDLYDIGQRKYTEETIRQLVEETQPDLITMTGDRCYADGDMNGGTLLTVTDNGVLTEHQYVTIEK